MKKRLICFDLDGTLLGSDDAHAKSFNGAFLAFGLKKQSKKNLLKEMNGQTGVNTIRALFPTLKIKDAVRICDIHEILMIKEFWKLAKPITKNTVQSLRALKKNFDLALMSNSSTPEIKVLLRGAKVPSSLFTVIVGRDIVKRGKPAPDMVFKVEQLARKKVDLVVGDSIYDVLCGKKAKKRTIAVLTGKFSKKQLKKEKPDSIVRNIDFLQAKLEKQNFFKR